MSTENKFKGNGKWGIYGDWISYVETLPDEQLDQELDCNNCTGECSMCMNSLVGLEMDFENKELTKEEEEQMNKEFISRIRDYVGYSLIYRTLGEKPYDKVLMEILYRNPEAEITEQEKFNAKKDYEYRLKSAECYKEYIEGKDK